MPETIRILLVEDNPADARLLMENIRDLGNPQFEFTHAVYLADALEIVKKKNFDIVLLDLNLPDSEGARTIQSMAASSPTLPIIVLTGLEDKYTESEAVHLGAQDYMIKSELSPKAFLRAVRYAMDRKRIITKLDETTRDLDRHVARLEAAYGDLESFTYSVSHDLQAPLHAIKGFSELIQQTCGSTLGEEPREYLCRLIHATQKMSALINDLLYLSRVSRQEMDRQQVNLSTEVRSAIHDLQAAEPARTVTSIIEPDVIVDADPRLLKLALGNLIGNAWKFTKEIPDTRIEFGRMRDSTEPVYFIKDNGAGFDMKFADKLFLPFKRFHPEKRFPGTGIGLAIVERVIKRHNGKIWAKSSPGNGAVFYFTLGE